MCKCSSRRQLEWREHTEVIGDISSLFHLHGDAARHQNVSNFLPSLPSFLPPSQSSSLSVPFHFHFKSKVFFPLFLVAMSNKSSSNVSIVQWQHVMKSVSLQSSSFFFFCTSPAPYLFSYRGNTRKPENVEYCHPPTRFPFSNFR